MADDALRPFLINSYKFITQGKQCSKHGGLAIYLNEMYEHNKINYEITCNHWEYQCIEVFGGDISNNIIICNVYRPPRLNNNDRAIKPFLNEFS